MSIDKDPATEEDTASGGPAEPLDPHGAAVDNRR